MSLPDKSIYERCRFNLGRDLVRALDSDDSYAEVVFEVGTHTIKAHKVVIAYHSKYFTAMLDKESAKCVIIKITDFDYNVVRGFLEYIYSGGIAFKDVAFASSLRIAAHKYEQPILEVLCEDFIVANVEKTTAAILTSPI